MSATAAFGRLLREARELRGLTPQQLASETHVPLGHIEALEAGRLHAVPGGLYRRAEVRAYADAVGLDPVLVLSELRYALDAQTGGALADEPVSFNQVEALLATNDTPAHPPGEPTAQEQPHMAASRADAVDLPRDPRGRWRFAAALVLGGAALLWEQAGRAPTVRSDMTEIAEASMGVAEALDGVVRIAEAARPAPTLSRALFAEGAQQPATWRRETRLEAGRLVVHSTPAGARVTVNGVGWGETPVAIRYLPYGTMHVRLVKDNHRAQERTVILSSDSPTSTIRVTLPAIPGRRDLSAAADKGPMLVVTTTPPGANITVNGIGWGSTPAEIPFLPPGRQVVRVVKDTYNSEERIVQVAHGRSQRVTIALTPRR